MHFHLDSKQLKMNGNVKIEGINLSERLVTVNIENLPYNPENLNRFCRVLAENQININYLSAGNNEETGWITCCVAENDHHHVENLIGSKLRNKNYVEVVPSSILLTIFPHRNSFKGFGKVLRAFIESGSPLYGLTSSISAFSSITKYNHVKETVLKLQEFLDVHPEQIYNKEELNNWKEELQTSAVYMESKIKTYGFKKDLGLCLMELHTNMEHLTKCCAMIENLEDSEIRFEQVYIKNNKEGYIWIYVLFQKIWKKKAEIIFQEMNRRGLLFSFNIISSAGLISFYGPHYGDRFGIVDTTLNSLKKEDIHIILIGCSGSSIRMVLNENETDKAKRLLEQGFEVPSHVKK